MALRRYTLLSALYSTFVWLATLYLLSLTVRIYHFHGNMFYRVFTDLFDQAFMLDEELILLTCLTWWSICWGCVFASLHLSRSNRRGVWVVALSAVASFVLQIIGGTARHAFHGNGAKVFHAAFSAGITIGFVFMLFRWFRRLKRQHLT